MKVSFLTFCLALPCLIQWVSCTPAGKLPNTVRFEITLTWEDWEVAGAVRKTILTNGQFPGPKLRLSQGDHVEFVVNNHLPFDTAVHFHGIDQLDTPWSDGVPGLSQRPIQPDNQYIYRWKATQYGAYFYHAHSRSQIDDGLYGAIYIEPDHSLDRPFDGITDDASELKIIHEAEKNTQPIFLSDWTLLTSEEIWKAEEATGLDAFCVNAMLINGKGSVQCLGQDTLNQFTTPAMKAILGDHKLTDTGCMPPIPAMEGSFPKDLSAAPPGFYKGCKPYQGPIEVFKVDPGSGYVSWDLMNSAGVSTTTFSIDEHPMWVYASDGRYIEPMLVDAVTLSNGVRYSVLVKLDKPSGNYHIRTANTGANQVINATAIMSYTAPHQVSGPSKPYIDITGAPTTPNTTSLDETKIIPFPVEVPSMSADRTYKLTIDRYNASYRWVLGENSFPLTLDNKVPALYDPNAIPKGLTARTELGEWVDLIFTVQPGQPPHPIHKHSNKYFVIGYGQGSFDYESVEEAMKHIPQSFNFKNPQIRDTFATPPSTKEPTWLAVRYHVVNPGAFLVHCHIQVHLAGGMALALLDGVDRWPTVPKEYKVAGLE